MGRNNKKELQYFPVDVDILRDKKVRRLTRKYARGAEFYLYLLCAIYSDKGYYMPVDDETAFDIADDMRIPEAEVEEMLNFCTSENVGLFSREMREQHGILTSRGIQQRYAETIRQLKRKVSIDSEYLLIDAENDGIIPEIFRQNRKKSEETVESSEEMRIYSEEMRESSEEMAIYSDKSKVEENRIKENKKEEIYLSAAGAKEREIFLKILLFEKKLLFPQTELDRFVAHYEKTGWVDANGNPIKNRFAALRSWSAAKDAEKCPARTVAIWMEVVNATARADPEADCTPMLTLFRGLHCDGQVLHIAADSKSLADFMERHIGAIRPVIDKNFGPVKLNYRILRK